MRQHILIILYYAILCYVDGYNDGVDGYDDDHAADDNDDDYYDHHDDGDEMMIRMMAMIPELSYTQRLYDRISQQYD